MTVREKANEVERGLASFLVAITIQSGTNVCGTKWSVMGNRLLQLHNGAGRKKKRGQRWVGEAKS